MLQMFAGCFLTAFTIANTVDDESAGFSYHMIAGMVMVFAVLWRIVWGMVGSAHARFTDLSLLPAELSRYLKGALTGKGRFWAGHNPASSWAAVIMMSLALGLGVTGYLMTSSSLGEGLKEVHEVLANSFIVIVFLHIAGIIMHTAKHKDPIGKSMINGCKQHLPEPELPVASHTIMGVVALTLTLGLGMSLLAGYDPAERTVSVAGVTLQLTEFESDE